MTELYRVIEPEAFIECLGLFDNTTIAEIIDIFMQEYPEKMKNIEESIHNANTESVRFHAHSLKGVIANFGAPQALLNIKLLEEYARNAPITDCENQYKLFKPYGDQLIVELSEIRKKLSV